MTPILNKINPLPKAESWKFSPKIALSKNLFKKPHQKSFEEVLNCKIAIGPSSHQFEALSISELQEDGYLSVEQISQIKWSDKNTDRAVIDKTIGDLYFDVKTVKINFLKPLPSTLWISPNQSLRVIDFVLQNGISQNICIFEASTLKAEAKGFLLNFKVSTKAQLELGVCLNTANSSFSQINIETEGESKVNVFSLLAGDTDYKRLEANIYQKGTQSEVSLNGICFARNAAALEFHSNIFHLNKNQNTTQIYKTICSNKGKSIFGGRIHLTENAAGATVEQLNNNLLIGKRSSVDTQPELNIYQDDVKANHGATISTIDENHLFYFASRGFKLEQSKKMLLKAFCKSSFSNLKNKGLTDYFSDMLNEELKNVD